MQATPTGAAHDTATDELGGLVDSWLRHLRAQRMSPATLSTYGTSARQLAAFLAAQGMPTTPAAITREHVEAFVSHLLTQWKPATAHNRYRALRTFFGWLVEEGEMRDSPMARMKPPRLPEEPPAVRWGSCGLSVRPNRLLSVCRSWQYAGVFVLPIITAPWWRSRATASASPSGT